LERDKLVPLAKLPTKLVFNLDWSVVFCGRHLKTKNLEFGIDLSTSLKKKCA